MKKTVLTILALLIGVSAHAGIRVTVSYPYIRDLVQKISGDTVRVASLAPGQWDPHFVVPRPSLIAQVRQADLLIINGAELEVGWLPQIIQESHNAKVKPGSRGFLDLSQHVRLLDARESVTRALGDVHPSGNPHFHLDPDNIPLLARAICGKLIELDPANALTFQQNLETFLKIWGDKIKDWDVRLAPLREKRVIQYHRLYNYLLKKYGIVSLGEIEPLPGIPPTGMHIGKIADRIKQQAVSLIITDVYHSSGPANKISSMTGIRSVILPHDVNAVKEAQDITGLFDEIVRRLVND